MMWRAWGIAILLVTVGVSARPVPAGEQSPGANPAAVAGDHGNSNGVASHAHKKMVRRCARRSRLGICERWNIPKSAMPSARKSAPTPDARNEPAKH